ncbi:hypothetical protein AG1IA_07991 [Rhizoctonia solani AG-1 IA]|uniref:Uncharacterized protein n=1 Tax=Thanatephorus cucumeris (strain AG1-IA) TaxID=983506 RepID=L8WMI0_THACA|nr:hypothetical protein AG1IA_07991 [Rhizoctonia solani AG-1 IA]
MTYSRARFCSCPPTPSISSGAWSIMDAYSGSICAGLDQNDCRGSMRRIKLEFVNMRALPRRSPVLSRVFGRPSGGLSNNDRKASCPAEAALCLVRESISVNRRSGSDVLTKGVDPLYPWN